MEINSFLLVFILLILILAVFFPISGYYGVRRLRKSIAEGDRRIKIKFYYQTIIWSWLPLMIILFLMKGSSINIGNIGLKWISINTESVSEWVLYPSIGLYLVHLSYNIYSIIAFKNSKEKREKIAKSIPTDVKYFLPMTQDERRAWNYLSFSAGFTEEIVYRGYLFYALAVIFPGLSLFHILIISTLVFGIGHIYLGKEVIKSTFLGLLFGIYYIAFGSVIPVIIIHVAQDLVITNIFKAENENNS